MGRKILTFSYDDGVKQDVRLIELFNKYGMKATFNINSGLLNTDNELLREGAVVQHNKHRPEDLKYIYEGHEIAGHSITHPRFQDMRDEDIIREVEDDRLKLSELVGYEVVGFAYPFGNIPHDGHISGLLKNNTGVKYCRNTISTYSFDRQQDLHIFEPTVYHHMEWDKMLGLGERFLSLNTPEDQIFYIWGHAYEFDIHDDWARFEEFLSMMAGKKDIEYLTNKEALL